MNRIRFFRRQANLTQEELGKTIGTYTMKVHRYETGRIKVPREMRNKLASVLGLPLEVIFPDSEV